MFFENRFIAGRKPCAYYHKPESHKIPDSGNIPENNKGKNSADKRSNRIICACSCGAEMSYGPGHSVDDGLGMFVQKIISENKNNPRGDICVLQ